MSYTDDVEKSFTNDNKDLKIDLSITLSLLEFILKEVKEWIKLAENKKVSYCYQYISVSVYCMYVCM